MNKNEFFGLDYDNYIGSLRQINKKRIIERFLSNQRLLHLTKFAFDEELLIKRIQKMEKFAQN